MKTFRIFSVIFMGLGILLYLIGLLFKIQHWPDMFAGFTSGPIFALIGVVIFIITLFKKNKIHYN
jgi:uncharacterized membrane protein YiaA